MRALRLLAAVVGIALASCAGPSSMAGTQTLSTTYSTAAPPTPGNPPVTLAWTERARIHISHVAERLAVSGDTVLWLVDTVGNSQSLSLGSFDLASGRERVVATPDAGASIGAAAIDGGLIAYSTVIPSRTADRYSWTITLLRDGRSNVIRRSDHPTVLELVPIPSVQAGVIAWAESASTSVDSTQLAAYDVGAGKIRVVADNSPGSVTVAAGQVIYDGDSGLAGRDVFTVDAYGRSRSRQISSSGMAAFPSARNGYVAWQEPMRGDPQRVLAKPIAPATKDMVMLDPGANQGNIIVGDGFVCWLSRAGHIDLRRPDGSSPVADVSGDTQVDLLPRYAVSGRTLVWASYIDGTKFDLHIVDIG